MRNVLFVAVLLLIAATAFAGGAGEQTQINVELDDTVYISPDESPGTQDSVDIPIAVESAGGNANVIVAYTLEITNPSGDIVWTQSAVDESEDPGFFGRLFQNLGLAQRQTTVSMPESVAWDGSYLDSPAGSDGASVPDGEYTWILTATLASETVVETEPRAIIVDNTAPSATASVDNRYFSPDGDDRQDTVTLTQSTSSEDEWTGQFVSGAQTIFDVVWNGEADAEFVWDGTTPAGTTVEDGTYVYTLEATDRAGNTGSIEPIEVVVDTAERTIAIEPVPQDSALAFSPNGDGIRDTLDITFGENVTTELLESAVLTATTQDGTEVGSVAIGDQIGGVVSLTGYLDQAQRERAPEGTYLLSVEATYLNGAVATAGPVEAVLDTTAPSGSISVGQNIFSPEGDGNNDTVTIMHGLSNDASWVGYVYEAGGAVLERFDLGSNVPDEFEWNGEDLSGRPVPDGTYSYSAIGIDPAGNQTQTNQIRVSVDRRETTIDFGLSRDYFSPNGDGQGDVVEIEPILSVPSGVESYSYQIVDVDGRVLVAGSGTGEVPESLTWDGSDGDGVRLPEGEYFAALELVYRKGNEPSAVSSPITIDFTVPQVSLRATGRMLTPDGDGENDTVEFIPFVDPINEISSFTGQIVTPGGRVVSQIRGEQPRGTAFWDGTTSSGQQASDGGYVGVLQIEHRNGTIREARTGTIALGDLNDQTPPEVVLQLSPQTFSPDGDGVADSVMVVLSVMDQSLVDNWKVDVVAPDGSVFYTYNEGGEPIRSFEWDGMNDEGERVTMATVYDVRYEVTDMAGNTATGSEPLTVDFLTEERYGMRRIALPDVLFEGFTARYLGWDAEISARNEDVLDTIARGMELFPDSFLELHGHATSLLYYDEELAALEQEQTLIPLSARRIAAIRQALLDRGVDEDRLANGPAWGAERPQVEFSNLEERFQNRRVEVYWDEE
jgi:flagellar hook assembly protein FlgD